MARNFEGSRNAPFANNQQAPDSSAVGSAVSHDELPVSNVVWSEVPVGSVHPFEASERDRYLDPLVMARGGMGRVSTVTDRRLLREVALKEVQPDEPDAAGLQRRLAQEAWITAQLEHPGIVPVYDAGKGTRGRLFFTMRLIRGRSLAAALAARELDEATLLRHFLAVCQAMGYAHARGVVHRDLKPANIMIGAFGETQIVDWGVACVLGGPTDTGHDHAPRASPAHAVVPDALEARTEAGARVGTPAYMSPEQANAEPAAPIGRASDVWCLGAILFEIVAGRPLSEGLTTAEIYRRLERGPLPRLEDVRPSASPELAAVVARALHRDPAARYPDARHLADDIAAYLDGRRVDAYRYSLWDMAKRFGRAFRIPLLVAAAALVAIAVVFAASFAQTLDERDRAQAAETAAEAARDRALAAEQHATRAFDQAERSYAVLLVQRAREAQRHHAQAEAELLAAHALVRIPSPEARGVLARYDASARAELRAVDVAPDCASGTLSPHGTHLLCLEPDATSLWTMPPDPRRSFALELRWRVPGRYDEAAFISDARVLVADTAWSARTLLDVETGAELPLAVPLVAARVKATAGVVLGDDGAGGLVVWREDTASGIRVDAPMREPWAVSGNGRVAVVYDESTVRPVRIDLAAGTHVEMGTLPFREQGPISAALDHAGERAAFGGTRGDLIVVAVADGALLSRERVTERALVHTLWSPDDRWLAVRDERGWISIHDTRNTIRLALPRTTASQMAWHAHDGGLELVTYGAELSVYRLPVGPSATTFLASTGIATLALNPRGDWVALPAGSGEVRVHRVATGELIGELPGDGHAVAKDAAFLHGNDALAITWPGHFALGVWRPGRDSAATSVDTGVNFRRVITAANGDILTAGYGREMFHFAGSLARREFALGDGGSPIDAVATPDGRVLAWLSSRGGIETATIDRERLGVPRLVTEARGATRIALSGDGRLLAIARPGDVRLVVLASGELIRSVTVPGARICEVALSPLSIDGTQLAAGTIDGEVWLWDSAGTLQMIGAGHAERVSGLAFGPSGDWLLSAGWDGAARRWDLRGLATPPRRQVEELERTWGQGIDHAVHADLR